MQKQEALRRGRALAWELTGQGPRALLQALCFPSSVKQRAQRPLGEGGGGVPGGYTLRLRFILGRGASG